jgi:hypothetical protein
LENDPVHSWFVRALSAGQSAAGFVATGFGRDDFRFYLGPEVVVRVKYRDSEEQESTLLDVVDWTRRGRRPTHIGALPGSWITMAMAMAQTSRGLVLGFLDDLRGVTQAPMSDYELPADRVVPGTTGNFGERLTGGLLSTTKASGRLARARRLSGADDQSIVAAASAEVLLAQGAPTLLSWMVSEVADGKGTHLAWSPNLRDEEGTSAFASQVYSRIKGRAIRLYEEDAGVERRQTTHMPVSKVSLTQVDEVGAPDHRFSAVELHDLVDRAHLTAREWQVLPLHNQGFTAPQIGALLGMKPSTVDNHLLHVRQKLLDFA